MSVRESSPKGRAKREEILRVALEAIARNGYRGSSLREIAQAAGLSNAGLLHHFDSKEHLLTEVLRMKDQATSTETGDAIEVLLKAIEANTGVPGLVTLFTLLSAEAVDPEHAAHGFFAERYRELRASLEEELRDEQASGRLDPEASPERLARILVAVSDGLQTQWLIDPSFDMAADLAHLVSRLRRD